MKIQEIETTNVGNGVHPFWATSSDPFQLEYRSLSFLLQRCWDLVISYYIRDSFSFNEDSMRLLTLIPLHTSRRIIPYMNKSLKFLGVVAL